jgi:catabolite regulation protein CreA
VVSEFKTSGVIFKDSVQVLALKDPEIEGVTIYYTDYTRSIAEKLTSKEDAFSDPSQSSISCVVSGKAAFTSGSPDAVAGKEGMWAWFARTSALSRRGH